MKGRKVEMKAGAAQRGREGRRMKDCLGEGGVARLGSGWERKRGNMEIPAARPGSREYCTVLLECIMHSEGIL